LGQTVRSGSVGSGRLLARGIALSAMPPAVRMERVQGLLLELSSGPAGEHSIAWMKEHCFAADAPASSLFMDPIVLECDGDRPGVRRGAIGDDCAKGCWSTRHR